MKTVDPTSGKLQRKMEMAEMSEITEIDTGLSPSREGLGFFLVDEDESLARVTETIILQCDNV